MVLSVGGEAVGGARLASRSFAVGGLSSPPASLFGATNFTGVSCWELWFPLWPSSPPSSVVWMRVSQVGSPLNGSAGDNDDVAALSVARAPYFAPPPFGAKAVRDLQACLGCGSYRRVLWSPVLQLAPSVRGTVQLALASVAVVPSPWTLL